MSERQQIGDSDAGGRLHAELSMLPTPAPSAPPDNGSRAVALVGRPPGLEGVAIPSRNRTIRRRVFALYWECNWLAGGDISAAVRWAVLGEKFRRLAELLDRFPEGGVVRVSVADLEPRKALGELRAISGEMSRLETALGLTAAARASLGVNLTHMKDLAAAMSSGDGDD